MEDPNKIQKPLELQPKYIPVKCVVCNGYGKVTYERIICHGCKGKGYILVEAQPI